jgi:hypothetical protein
MSFYVPMNQLKHSGRILSKFLPIIEHLRHTILSREKKGVAILFSRCIYDNVFLSVSSNVLHDIGSV